MRATERCQTRLCDACCAESVGPIANSDRAHRSARPRPAARIRSGIAVVGDRVLRLLFSDGTAGDVDFSTERWTGVLARLNDPAYFAQVTVDPEAGTIAWPDGIDLAPEPLYEQAKARPLIAA